MQQVDTTIQENGKAPVTQTHMHRVPQVTPTETTVETTVVETGKAPVTQTHVHKKVERTEV